jgi:hypothetical protein
MTATDGLRSSRFHPQELRPVFTDPISSILLKSMVVSW